VVITRSKLVFVFIMILSVSQGVAQSFRNNMAWRTMRNEITFGVGASNFMSDLGGRDMIGTDFLWDLEFSKTRPSINLMYGYYLAENFVWRTAFTLGRLEGDDKLTKEPFRMNRNLHARNDVYELGTRFDFFFLRERGGNKYGLRNKRGARGRKIGAKAGGVGAYLFAGISGYHHQPKAFYINQWVNLKPLRTEGQGMPEGPEEYSNWGIAIPMGFGVRKGLGNTGQWYIGLEFSYRFTFTDYLDDVSGYYYDKGVIGQTAQDNGLNGAMAMYLADPNLHEQAPDVYPNPNPWSDPVYMTDPGQMRGDITDRDGYMFAMLQVHYKIKKQPKRYSNLRRKRYRASF
jgi:hypothetical protein